MLWLAMIFLFRPYISHFKSDFNCVKGKVGLFNAYNLSSYLASHGYNILAISQPFQVRFWWSESQIWLQNWIYKIKSTEQSVLDVKNQIYQTKSIQSNLKKIHPTNFTKPNVEEPNLQNIKVKSNPSLSWAWPSSSKSWR